MNSSIITLLAVSVLLCAAFHLQGFKCICKEDYVKNNMTGVCEPICDPPCSKNGVCSKPNVCECSLGYKGPQCEEGCACHGHSECSDDIYAPCKKCQHNTGQNHCSKCLKGFYGNARNESADACKKCSLLCNGNTDLCASKAEFDTKSNISDNLEDVIVSIIP